MKQRESHPYPKTTQWRDVSVDGEDVWQLEKTLDNKKVAIWYGGQMLSHYEWWVEYCNVKWVFNFLIKQIQFSNF